MYVPISLHVCTDLLHAATAKKLLIQGDKSLFLGWQWQRSMCRFVHDHHCKMYNNPYRVVIIKNRVLCHCHPKNKLLSPEN